MMCDRETSVNLPLLLSLRGSDQRSGNTRLVGCSLFLLCYSKKVPLYYVRLTDDVDVGI